MAERPLSPHLSVYRMWPTMVLSGLHRITGMALTAGLLLFTWWLLSVAAGPAQFETSRQVLGSGFVKLLLAGWLFSFVYHLCTGIRHLIWDMAKRMERPDVRQTRVGVIAAALVLFLTLGYLAFVRHWGAL